MTSNTRKYLRGLFYYLKKKDFKGLYFRVTKGHAKTQSVTSNFPMKLDGVMRFEIVTVPHTLFIANAIASRMRFHGIIVNVTTEMPRLFDSDYYLILGAHQFSTLPPGEKRIIFQLEQHLIHRWFTKKYLSDLENSFAIIEYASSNLSYLAERGLVYPHVFKLQIGTNHQIASIEDVQFKKDILFYGDSFSSPRRTKILQELANEFSITIVNDSFGEDLWGELNSHKILLNLHYQDLSLLETPRIFEALSHGMRVISEDANDSDDYSFPESLVTFVPQGNVELISYEIINAILNYGTNSEISSDFLIQNLKKFSFEIDRFLLGKNLIKVSRFYQIESVFEVMPPEIVISMPETYLRKKKFLDNYGDLKIPVFEGLRHNVSWLGCGLSYKYLATSAVKSGMDRVIIMEDDVVLPTNYEEFKDLILAYLRSISGNWDVFAGLIADLPEGVEVLQVDEFCGIRFITLSKMTGMVWNVYNKESLSFLAKWDPHNSNVQTNTIDRYLNSKSDLRVVVTSPYLFGHRIDARSSLWNVGNTQYEEMISETAAKLDYLVDEYLQHN